LSLVVIEVGWDCDDGLLDLLAELDFSNFLHLYTMISIESRILFVYYEPW
jgi:hypothetical protein